MAPKRKSSAKNRPLGSGFHPRKRSRPLERDTAGAEKEGSKAATTSGSVRCCVRSSSLPVMAVGGMSVVCSMNTPGSATGEVEGANDSTQNASGLSYRHPGPIVPWPLSALRHSRHSQQSGGDVEIEADAQGERGQQGQARTSQAGAQRCQINFIPLDVKGARLAQALANLGIRSVPIQAVRFLKHHDGRLIEAGKGTYSTVFVGKLEGREQTVAIKRFVGQNCRISREILDEARNLQVLQASGVVPELIGVTLGGQFPEDCCLLMNFEADGLTLSDILLRLDGHKITLVEWLQILFQLSTGLEKIHDCGVIVNDLKCDNVLVSMEKTPYKVKYIDFGLSTYHETFRFQASTERLHTFHYLAPEVRSGHYTSCESDIFSLGYLYRVINDCKHLSGQAVVKCVAMACMAEKPDQRPSLPSVSFALGSAILDHVVSGTGREVPRP